MLTANVSRNEARIGAWVARAVTVALLIGAVGTVALGGSDPIETVKPEPKAGETPTRVAQLPDQSADWDSEAVALHLKAWNGPPPEAPKGPSTDGGETTTLASTPAATAAQLEYLGRVTMGGAERALLSLGDEQRFVGVDGEFDQYTLVRIDDKRILVRGRGGPERSIQLKQRVSSLGSLSSPPVANQPIPDPRQAEMQAERMERMRQIRSGNTTTPRFDGAMRQGSDSDDGSEGS